MDVFVKNRKGNKLFCIFDGLKESLAGNLPAVLIVHGFKGYSTQEHITAISDALVSAGFITIRPDLTKNPGRSYLPFEDVTYGQEFSDLEDVFDYLLKMPEVDKNRIGIAGHSLGGTLVAQLTAKRDEIKSLATLSAVFDYKFVAKRIFKKPFAQVKKDFKEKGWSEVWSQSLHKDLKIGNKFYEDIVFRTAADFAKNITCPTLVVSGENDESVAQSHANRYFKNIGSKVKELKIIRGADHNYSSDRALGEVCTLTRDWFLANLYFSKDVKNQSEQKVKLLRSL